MNEKGGKEGKGTHVHMPSHKAIYVNENAKSCEKENSLLVLV